MDDLRSYINNLRHDFAKQTLDKKDVDADPVIQFKKWFKEAREYKMLPLEGEFFARAAAEES